MNNSIKFALIAFVFSCLANLSFADENEVNTKDEKIVKVEGVEAAEAVVSNLPNDFWIVGIKDKCPKELKNSDGSLNFTVLNCNNPYRFKDLPQEHQRDIILQMPDTDWSSFNERSEDEYSSHNKNFKVNFNDVNNNFGDSVKKNFNSFSHGCKPKRFKGGAKGIQCLIKF